MNKTRVLSLLIGILLVSSAAFAWKVGDKVTQAQVDALNLDLINFSDPLLDNVVFIPFTGVEYFSQRASADNNYVIFNAQITTLTQNTKDKGTYLVTTKVFTITKSVREIQGCYDKYGKENCLEKQLKPNILSNFNSQLSGEKTRITKLKSPVVLVSMATLLQDISTSFAKNINNIKSILIDSARSVGAIP